MCVPSINPRKLDHEADKVQKDLGTVAFLWPASFPVTATGESLRHVLTIGMVFFGGGSVLVLVTSCFSKPACPLAVQ